ncbi:hypothetical protein CJ179_10070 [Rhodococcus sp. ACS1]|uniref:glycosyltransferase family 4 protein n=1 Tax=Rhodococcus TaxID=1827 RepID=UPI000BB0F04A|nr:MULTISPECIES: glycosyltransferase family 4 protein [Rhodococcus]PBC51102.1 hypothetical protein CJ179_10070 [Rhodococcus sp. ACS1]QSE83048.1 glycosyltransferase family 4 protein [Rhodococcus koreensis]
MPTHEPKSVERLIVHQFDAARPSPGGIDTCIRGICKYYPGAGTLAVIGVDTGIRSRGHDLGSWEEHKIGERTVWFLPVARLDPANQNRIVPHSLRLVAGVIRNIRKIPRSRTVQVHRMDVAVAIKIILRPKLLAYFVHTQQNGLTGGNSDSLWRYGQRMHSALERHLIKTSSDVVVFNPEHADHASKLNPNAKFSPTWFDPDILQSGEHQRKDLSIIWVGRMEVPKDPQLALTAFARLIELDPKRGWTLRMIGGGTLENELRAYVAELPNSVTERVEIIGRMTPSDLSAAMATSHVFLMTSHAGYEGFPRVLVEAMASGLSAVVTHGSDTGGLVKSGVTGFTTSRDPEEISRRIIDATRIDPTYPRAEVSKFSALEVIGQIVRAEERNPMVSNTNNMEQ